MCRCDCRAPANKNLALRQTAVGTPIVFEEALQASPQEISAQRVVFFRKAKEHFEAFPFFVPGYQLTIGLKNRFPVSAVALSGGDGINEK
jgi:hypothetical protein